MGGRYCAINSHGVRRGGKHPRTECRGIPPTPTGRGEFIAKTEAHVEILLSTQLNVSVWWRHIHLGRHNSANRHAPAEHFDILFLKIAPKPLVCIDVWIPLNHYTFIAGNIH